MTQTDARDYDADRIETLLDAMTLAEQVGLLAGRDSWTTTPIERLGIPSLKMTDGPNGARGGGSLVGGLSAAAFPVGIALGATWNVDLVRVVGAAIGREAGDKGAQILLAPTVNMQRTAINGRNFECHSEDPFLAAEIAVAYVEGVQSTGGVAAIKHFVANEIETDRMRVSSDLDERTLRELYLPPFEATVKRAKVGMVMAAYNAVNGVPVSEHRALLTDLLRDEWGFGGVLTSDWGGTYTTVAALAAGLDLEMPGPGRRRGAKLIAALMAGEIDPETVRTSARRVIDLVDRVTDLRQPDHAERSVDRPEDRRLIRQAGAEAAVLLTNDGVLPLDPQALARIAVLGPNAQVAQIMGGGSAQLNPHRRITPLEGLIAQAGAATIFDVEAGCDNGRLHPLLRETFRVDLFRDAADTSAPVSCSTADASEVMWLEELATLEPEFLARLTTTIRVERSGEYSFGLASTGTASLAVGGRMVIAMPSSPSRGATYFGDGSDEAVAMMRLEAGRDYPIAVDYINRSNEDSMSQLRAVRLGMARRLGDADMDRAVALAAAADTAVIFVGRNGDWDTEGFDRVGNALPGRQDELIGRVAAVNRRTIVVLQTGGPVAMPWCANVSAILQAWYPGQECGHAIADVLFGAASPGGRLPQTFFASDDAYPAVDDPAAPTGHVAYAEGLAVGYRRTDAVLFPFGHGLSYARFAYGDLRVDRDMVAPGEQVIATIDITNVGTVAAQEVVQLYVQDAAASVERPAVELKGFAKLTLAPGETATGHFVLDMRAFAFFDPVRRTWVAEAGSFTLIAAASATDCRATATVTLAEDWIDPSPKAMIGSPVAAQKDAS